jgi:hypothetical protein
VKSGQTLNSAGGGGRIYFAAFESLTMPGARAN